MGHANSACRKSLSPQALRRQWLPSIIGVDDYSHPPFRSSTAHLQRMFISPLVALNVMPPLPRAAPLTLKGARGGATRVVELPVPTQYRWVTDVETDSIPYNLAQAYARVADDFFNGTLTAPTFDDAVTRHRMIDAIERTATTGRRSSYNTRSLG